jgi:hypothetical protein
MFHYGGVYAALGHLLTPLGHGAALGHHLEVRLLVHHEGGGLAEGRVVLHEQDERHSLASVLLAHSLLLTCVPTKRPEATFDAVYGSYGSETPLVLDRDYASFREHLFHPLGCKRARRRAWEAGRFTLQRSEPLPQLRMVLLTPVRAIDPIHVVPELRVAASFAGLVPPFRGTQIRRPSGFTLP